MKILDLFEGLIKVPTYTEERINRLITVIVLLALKKKSSTKYPEINKILKKEIKLNNITGKLPDDKVLAYFVKWDGLSSKYPDATLAERDGVKGIYLAFSMEHKGNSLGSWNNKNSSMVLFPRVLPGWDQFPNCDKDNIKWFIETLQDTAKHELMHAVQYTSLADKDPKQVGQLPNYHDYGDDYHNSQIEFDPTIVSCAGDLVKTWRLFKNTGISGKPLNLKMLFKTFVCVLPEKKFTLYTHNEFFKSLKNTNPEQWKKAIKKFTIEVNRLLAQSKESLSEGIEVTPVDFTEYKTMQQIEDFVNKDKTWLNRLNYFNWKNLNTPPENFYSNSRYFRGSDQSKWRYIFYDVPAILTKGNPQGLYKGDMDRTRLEFDFETLKPIIRPSTEQYNKTMGVKVFPTILKNILAFMKKDKLQIEAEKEYHNTTYYIRFGRWREEEQSKNFLTNEMEKGVSCYNAAWDTDTKKWTLETDVNPDTITGTLQGLIDGYVEKPTKKIFLVKGTIIGEGSDDEPLLKNVKAVKELTLNDIQIPDIFEDEELEDLEQQKHDKIN